MATLRVDLDDYPQLQRPGAAVLLRAHHVWLVRGKRRLRAYWARCPHKPKKGRVMLGSGAKGCFFRCPLHDWTFSRKGKATGKSKTRMKRLPLAVKGAVAKIQLP